MSLLHNLYSDFFIENGNFLVTANNINDLDPLLDGNFHLTAASPCVDAGTAGVPDPPGLPLVDIDNAPRIVDGDGDDVAVIDIGADEWFVPDHGDINGDGEVGLSDLIVVLRLITDMGGVASILVESDINGDHRIGLDEALFVLQAVADLRP